MSREELALAALPGLFSTECHSDVLVTVPPSTGSEMPLMTMTSPEPAVLLMMDNVTSASDPTSLMVGFA
jgi:hypothetical protein